LNDILGNLLIKAWNDRKLVDGPGHHKDISFIDDECYTKVEDVLYGPVQITILYTVKFSRFQAA